MKGRKRWRPYSARHVTSYFDNDKIIELARMYADDFSQYDCIVLRDQLGTSIVDARDGPNLSNCIDLGTLIYHIFIHTIF
jgi:hypothetical protein